MKSNKQYLVGYIGDIQCVYGPDDGDHSTYIDKMTLKQAKKKLHSLSGWVTDKTIYKLVPVK